MSTKGLGIKLTIAAVCVLSILTAQSYAQFTENLEHSNKWELSFFTGWMTGGDVVEQTELGNTLTAEQDDGFMIGLRFGQDAEYLGWEGTVAGSFHDLDAEDTLGTLYDDMEANMFLMNLNANLYPFGNKLDSGRIRPFVTAGPGFVCIESDLPEADNDAMVDLNAGMGVKFLLGTDGNPVLRLDYRWHYMMGDSDDLENMYRQELALGIGFQF